VTTKADFNAEEWDRLRQGPAAAAMVVIAADRGGTVRESLAVGREYTDAMREAPGTLLAEVAGDPPKIDREALGNAQELPVRGPQVITEAVDILEAKGTPEEVAAFKRFCLDVAEQVAEATKSGGFLGIGGKRISESESLALDNIAATLGIERSLSGPAPADAAE
jgi:hypothetical protein